MKYCMKCGQPLPDDALFCFKCGAKQEVPVQVKEEKIEEQPKVEEIKPEPVKEEPVVEKQPEIIAEPVKEEPAPIVEPEPVHEPEPVVVQAEPIKEEIKPEPVVAPVQAQVKEEPKVAPAQPQVQKEQPNVEEKKRPADTLRLRESIILLAFFVVFYIVYLILNKVVLNSDILPRLPFFFANLGFVAMFVIKMVKSIIRKKQLYIVFHIMGVAIVGAALIGQLIILANL